MFVISLLNYINSYETRIRIILYLNVNFHYCRVLILYTLHNKCTYALCVWQFCHKMRYKDGWICQKLRCLHVDDVWMRLWVVLYVKSGDLIVLLKDFFIESAYYQKYTRTVIFLEAVLEALILFLFINFVKRSQSNVSKFRGSCLFDSWKFWNTFLV